MDGRLLSYYERELRYLREVGAEFARDFPKIAGRLSLEEFTCADPYVERLLEGFAFLSARVLPAYGWRMLFVLGGIIPIVLAVLLFRVLPE